MTVARSTVFWSTITIIALLMLVLLHEILLPFAVGMALAYLLVPAVDKLERIGINRGLAALILILVLAVGFVGLVLVMLPALVGELRFFVTLCHPGPVARRRHGPPLAAQDHGPGTPDRGIGHPHGGCDGQCLAR
jgi:hypothetical protein